MAKPKKISEVEFTHRFITGERDEDRSTGVHSKFSGYNEAFRLYYDGADPVKATTKMAEAGDLVVQFRRGGVMLYLPGEEPKSGGSNGKGAKALAAMGLS